MDLQTYICWKYGFGDYLLPSMMSHIVKHGKSLKQVKSRLKRYDNICKKYTS